MRVGGEQFLAAPGSALRRALGSLWEGGGGWGGWAAPESAPESRWGGDRGTPRKHKEAQSKAPFALQRTRSGQRDVDGRSADGRMLLRALRDVLWPGRSTFHV